MMLRFHTPAVALGGLLVCASAAIAAPPAGGAAERSFRHPRLFVPPLQERPSGALVLGYGGLDADLAALGAPSTSALFDVRAGRWSTLVVSTPLVPGRGNTLRWGDLGVEDPGGPDARAEATWAALRRLLERWQAPLRLDLREVGPARVSASAEGTLVQVHAGRVVGGVRVRDAALTAVVSHGNLVLFGLTHWGDVAPPSAPAIAAERARQVVTERLRPHTVESFGAEPQLELIPLAREEKGAVVAGNGYEHRLAWVLGARVSGDLGSWQALVDAASGELLALQDTNQYQSSRRVVGGVYPTSNDGLDPDGLEQPGYPMPYADVTAGDATLHANGGGGAGCLDGTIGTSLTGRYVRIADVCGAVDETSAGSLDLGTSAGTNCTVPAGHSAGDTHAARTTYYALNRMMEQARGYLPENEWLQQPLTANVNINQACNAFWNGSTVNFFRAGSGCANTGEIASIVDHELAHGLDDNDANGLIGRPAEAFGFVLSSLRQRDSCIGRGFLPAANCNSYGDPCLSCTGIEDVDWARHASGVPHGLSDSMFCPIAPGASGPCGRENFCESRIVGEAGWDLAARDLRNPGTFNYDANTALEIATRLFYLGSQSVDNWYTCTAGIAGCGATGGYLSLLAADDDDGNLANGTPHMSAIFAAFNRHGIACATPAVADSGCAGGPATAPTLTATAQDQAAALSWTAVAGAARYGVYRAEGVKGCDAGKVKVGETTGTSFRDEGLLNGFSHHYAVLPIGEPGVCLGRMSACQTVVPTPGPNLAFDGASPLQFGTGDGDAFLDNCEVATVQVALENTGSASLTNVRILSVAPLSNPVQFLDVFPLTVAPTLSTCGTATAGLAFMGRGMSHDGTAEWQVTFTAGELFPLTRTAVLRWTHVESDFEPQASRTWSFETDLEGWQVVEGTFTRASAGGGAAGSSFYLRSSQGLVEQCDRIRSPLVQLQAGSTLALAARYEIEPGSAGEHYDRANVAVTTDAGTRATISPDGGNLYSVPPGSLFGACSLVDDPGWNGTNPGHPAYSESTWSAGALSPGGASTGEPVRLDIVYASDVVVALDGFRFDEVTLTDFAEQAPDAQADACADVVYFEGFDDATPPPWTFAGPWRRQEGGHLSSRRRAASAVADDFDGCEKCTLTTAFRTGGGRRRALEPRVLLWFHWQDDANHVELELSDGLATLRRRLGGVVEASNSAPFTLGRNRRYEARISYDGGAYDVAIDGVTVISLATPDGSKGTIALGSDRMRTSFDYVRVE